MIDKLPSESDEFKMTGARFVSEMIFSYGAPWMLSLSITALVGLVFGIAIDLRWLVIGLMIVFLIIPMFLMFLYYYYGMRKECYVNIIPHTLSVRDDGISLNLRFPIYSEDDYDDQSDREEEENELSSIESATEKMPDLSNKTIERVESFPFGMMESVRVGNNALKIYLKFPHKGFIWIPVEAYQNKDDIELLYEILDKRINAIKQLV